eukprot:TRINITY_DN6657_c0_g1_i2.p1 TRINITY_DN6657_c0_g1~~TRINITY_DN6657_c0_g1_i2.p1  ORF type:complete len:173 (+),score=19.44 TRINITY_DN6657_c0_g1_i2:28-519(+)
MEPQTEDVASVKVQEEARAKADLKRKKSIRLLYIVGILAYLVGIASIAFYPQYAHNTYMSENALLPGIGGAAYWEQDLEAAKQISDGFAGNKKSNNLSDAEWIASRLRSESLEVHLQNYEVTSANGRSIGTNVHCIIRAPKGSGTESIGYKTLACQFQMQFPR